ncbi:hypothetical protein PENANT_c174G08097 [Penicillium antarcticum]|uniref:mitogen-activated protein kinase n=1 Tax=Penicillium antarcticum TaxID=416450 RepID=A0A1V6PBM6_9EURO|nr:hypothetical protein PENANT_c174G08097 [Penicillium antarcticum]
MANYGGESHHMVQIFSNHFWNTVMTTIFNKLGTTGWNPLGWGYLVSSGMLSTPITSYAMSDEPFDQSSAKDQILNRTVAVKKLCDPFRTAVVAKHMFREIKLLIELKHENIINMQDIFVSPSEQIYLVTELMVTDLHTLLKTRKVDGQFTQLFVYQIMRGLKYIHSAGIIHRDLKPSNILINENCDLKICDFGLARTQDSRMTGYVSTRYYRAPEIMLTWKRYNEKVDIWSAGCIFAEMIIGRPLFPGKNHIDQYCVITELLGSPSEDIIANVSSENTLKFIHSLPKQAKKPLKKLIPTKNEDAVSLLEGMLQIDVEKRCSAEETLKTQYLAPYHDPHDEPTAAEKFNWDYCEAGLSTAEWRTVIYSAILAFHDKSSENSSAVTNSVDEMDTSS